jgi:hypothetical protein
MTVTDNQPELWNDPDLLDFEDPTKRHLVAAKMRSQIPVTIGAARWVMFLQPVIAVVVPIFMTGIRAGTGDAEETAPTTTTTVADAAAETQRQGNGGAFLFGALVVLGVLIALMVLASRLSKLTTSSRIAALLLEGVVLLGAGSLAIRSFAPMPVAVTLSAGVVIALLLAPSSRRAIGTNVGDTSTRFDIRNLPTLEP